MFSKVFPGLAHSHQSSRQSLTALSWRTPAIDITKLTTTQAILPSVPPPQPDYSLFSSVHDRFGTSGSHRSFASNFDTRGSALCRQQQSTSLTAVKVDPWDQTEQSPTAFPRPQHITELGKTPHQSVYFNPLWILCTTVPETSSV